MCRLSKENSSDAVTESIDWLELKHTVDEEQSLTCKIEFCLPLSLARLLWKVLEFLKCQLQ